MRSDEQAEEEVRFVAKEFMRVVQIVTLAAQVASRVWEMRTRDFSTWKKEMEFWRENVRNCIDGLEGKGLTWRRRENGKHDLNVAFASIAFMKLEQVAVILELNPLSKGVGNGLMLPADVAVVMALADVDVGASVDVSFADDFAVEEGSLPKGSCRR